MLRGNYTVKIDNKGRIKLPAAYRRYIDEHYGSEFLCHHPRGRRRPPLPDAGMAEHRREVADQGHDGYGGEEISRPYKLLWPTRGDGFAGADFHLPLTAVGRRASRRRG